ncbi:DUF3551 domain-containing protein [Nitrobacter winogradskyi]|uniref:DUF3551 domain-containing protein n=1 Tax=Nitrobacter winogradskyi TaxID=913 RepID=UPI000673DCF8
MRTTLIALALISSCAAANASDWDRRHPFCMMLYTPVVHNDCSFATLEQCVARTKGLPAQCARNPYFAGANDRKRLHQHNL